MMRDKVKRATYSKEYMRKYRKKLKDLGIKRMWNTSGYYKKIRLDALKKLGGLKCAQCGCDSVKILEVNHLKGGGHQDNVKRHDPKSLFRDIVKEKVDIKEYNVLCKVCNAHHYVSELLKIKGHKVIWNP